MENELFTLQWFVGDSISEINHSGEGEGWLILFRSGSRLNIDCLWRLRVDDQLISTSLDPGQQFGLPAPFDALDSLRHHIGAKQVSAVLVRPKTTDLRVHFGSNIVLELLQDSGGYESWQAATPAGKSVIAMGNGDLSLA